MNAYVDESGCLGMKIGAGSSTFFTVVTTIFHDRSQVTACYDRIESLKNEMRIGREFRFTKCSHDQRVGFLKEMKQFNFNYFGLTINKALIAGFSKPFLHFVLLASFAQHADSIVNASVVIDKTGSSAFRKMMAKKLKNDLNEQFDRSVIKQVKSVESHKNNLLQLADMTCGAVARSFHPERAAKYNYRQILSSKEWGITEIP